MGCEHLGNIGMPLWIWNIGGAIATYNTQISPARVWGVSLSVCTGQIFSKQKTPRNKNNNANFTTTTITTSYNKYNKYNNSNNNNNNNRIPSDAGIDVNLRYKVLHLAPNSFFTWCPDPPNATFLQEILFLPSWKWKTTQNIPTKLLLEIHPFSTEPWLWEECYSAISQGVFNHP